MSFEYLGSASDCGESVHTPLKLGKCHNLDMRFRRIIFLLLDMVSIIEVLNEPGVPRVCKTGRSISTQSFNLPKERGFIYKGRTIC